jgi:hypothetical protein
VREGWRRAGGEEKRVTGRRVRGKRVEGEWRRAEGEETGEGGKNQHINSPSAGVSASNSRL